MNERIIKLITEADTYAWSAAEKYVARDCCNDGEVNYLWEDAFREKFAELIVEEMYDFIMEESASDNGIPDLGKVKQHFGVEL